MSQDSQVANSSQENNTESKSSESLDITLRNEKESDYEVVEELIREAFWNLYFPGCDVHYTANRLRKHKDFVKEMDFVAINKCENNKIVGNIMYTKTHIIDESSNNKLDTLTFGPICVHPKYQNKGIGTLLINHTKQIAMDMNAVAIIILGYPKIYVKHGFKNCIDFNVSNAQGKYPYGQMIFPLKKEVFKDNIKWKFIDCDGYDVDSAEAEQFDKKFVAKKKEVKPCQEEFSIAVRAYLAK